MRVPNSFPTLAPSVAHMPPKWCELSYTELSDFYHDLLDRASIISFNLHLFF